MHFEQYHSRTVNVNIQLHYVKYTSVEENGDHNFEVHDLMLLMLHFNKLK